MISLAERSYRESKTFVFDPKTRTASAAGGPAPTAVASDAPVHRVAVTHVAATK
jgi:hypothetical protein